MSRNQITGRREVVALRTLKEIQESVRIDEEKKTSKERNERETKKRREKGRQEREKVKRNEK